MVNPRTNTGQAAANRGRNAKNNRDQHLTPFQKLAEDRARLAYRTHANDLEKVAGKDL